MVTACGIERYKVGKDIIEQEADHLVTVWYNFAFWMGPRRRVTSHPLKGGERAGSGKTRNGQLTTTLRNGTRLWCQGGTWEGETTNVSREFKIDTDTALFISILNLEVDSEEYANKNGISPAKIPEIPSRELLKEARKVIKDKSTQADFTIENVTNGGKCSFNKNTLDYISPEYEILGIRPRHGLIPHHDHATHIKRSKNTSLLPSGAIFPKMMSAGYYIIMKPLNQGKYKMDLSGEAPFYGGKPGERFRNEVHFTITAE